MPDLPRLIGRGHGPALVVIPGIQGRWEWMAPALEALSARHRVLTFSLNAVGTRGFFDACIDYIDAGLAEEGLASAAVLGVSFGGLVAARYAGRRPRKVTRLVLASAPSPRWRPDPVSMRYTRRPRLSVPLFAVRSAARLGPEIRTGLPNWTARMTFAGRSLWRTMTHPMSPRRMASWVGAWMEADLVSDCRAIVAPTLVLTGEARLDHVVPVGSSLEYLQLIAGARHVVLPETGHIGLMTRPREFAALVTGFMEEQA
jgi:3-oxoadipate enol-lactonase